MDQHPAGNSPGRPRRNQRSRAPVALGFAVAAAFILLLGFLTGRAGDGVDPDVLPPIRILRPAPGDSVTAPLTVTFRTPAPLRLDPRAGWSAGNLHLHLVLDDRDIMPGADHITAHGDGTFSWRLAVLAPGARRLHLAWAGPDHRGLPGGSDTLHVHVRQPTAQ